MSGPMITGTLIRMITIGTERGMVLLDGGELRNGESTHVTAVSGHWAVLDDGRVISRQRGVEGTVSELRPLCIADAGDRVYVGTEEAHVFVLDAATGEVRRVESFDRIPSRDEWYTPWGAPPDTRSLAASRHGGLFVNVHVGGVWRNDGDGVWEEVVEVDADTHQIVADQNSGGVAVAAAIGAGWSADGGATWAWSDAGLHAPYCRAAAIAGDVLLISASTGPGTRDGRLYRRPLAGDRPFEPCQGGLPERFSFNLDTGQLAALEDEVVLGTADGRLFVSHDAGTTWDLAADGLGTVNCLTLS
ncbi:MAG: hypothetical protein ACRD0U_08050 [Acidimicrobiales bacterium]